MRGGELQRYTPRKAAWSGIHTIYAGNITGAEDANGGIVTYRYNSLGQVYEITDQEGNTESFYCDKEGRRETHIDRSGNVERTLYNMDNRLSYQRAEDKRAGTRW